MENFEWKWNSAFWDPTPNGRNVFIRAQHAFCFSFAGNEGTDIIKQLIHARVKWVNSNLSLWLIEEMMRNDKPKLELIKKLILGQEIIPTAKVILSSI